MLYLWYLSLFFFLDENEKETQLGNPHTDEELQTAIDPLLVTLDSNYDGFIDFTEYVKSKF